MSIIYPGWEFSANLPFRFARKLLHELQSTLASMCSTFADENPALSTQEVVAELNRKYMNEVRWVVWFLKRQRSLVERMPRQPSSPELESESESC